MKAGAPRTSLGQIGYLKFSVSFAIFIHTFLNDFLINHADNLNTQICHSIKKSPYEVVFGQPARTTPFPQLRADHDCIMEEDVEELISEGL